MVLIEETACTASVAAQAPASTTAAQQPGGQPPPSPAAVLAQCLKLLRGASDEHKFAGLVMVTKHVPALAAAGEVDAGAGANGERGGYLRQICSAVGPNFVHRLLRTAVDGDTGGSGGSGSGCGDGDGDRGRTQPRIEDVTGKFNGVAGAGGDDPRRALSVYQQIALGVLAAFFRDESLVARFVPVSPALVRTIRAANSVTQKQALCDALDCAEALAGSPGGMERLLRAGAATAIVGRLCATSRDRAFSRLHNGDRDARGGGGGSENGIGGGIEETKSGGIGANDTFCSPDGLGSSVDADAGGVTAERAETVAFAFVGRALEASAGNCLGVRELTAVAEAFRDDPTSAKFRFMDLLLRWAALQEERQEASLGHWCKRGLFPAALREGLLQALHGAAEDKHRDSALALLASLLRCLGQEWAVEEADAEGPSARRGAKASKVKEKKRKTRRRGTFVSFAVRCAAGEVRILLDETLSLFVPGAAKSSTVPSTGESQADDEPQDKARGPMGPPGVDPSIGLAAEIARSRNDGDAGGKDPGASEGTVSPERLASRAPLSSRERRSIKEQRAARLRRMVPVGLGVAESAIAFLCGAMENGEVEEEGGEAGDRDGESSHRWEDLPIGTLQDLQKTLVGLFGCVFDFLGEIRPWIAPTSAVGSEVGEGARPAPSGVDLWTLHKLGLACSRALGIWVAEDPESLPQRFLEALPVLLTLRSRDEPPDSDDEDSDDEADEEEEYSDGSVPNISGLAAFPGADRIIPGSGLSPVSSDSDSADEALLNILRALLALSYEPAPLAAMVEEGVAARLARLTACGPPAVAVLLASENNATDQNAGPVAPPEQLSEAVRSPLITACGLLTNILTSAGHLAWPETIRARGARSPSARADARARPRAPSYPVLAHPKMGECIASLAEVVGVAGAARRAGGGPRWRLLAAHATLVVMTVARAAGPGNGLAPSRDISERKARWCKCEGDARPLSVWETMARAVDEALGSLSAAPGRALIGGPRDEDEASYEEGSIWQWCLECAREMDAAAGGARENSYVAAGVLPLKVVRALVEASADGRI